MRPTLVVSMDMEFALLLLHYRAPERILMYYLKPKMKILVLVLKVQLDRLKQSVAKRASQRG